MRGKKIAMIFQDPLSSLNPYYKVGWQISEMILAHEKISKKDARDRSIELLKLVGIPRPERRVDDYPHQFSGGMRQRAMIAMALSLDPAVLIADEPTTALDVTVQAQILDLLARLQDELGTAIIMITHDLGVVAEIADEVLVMYAGKPVEVGDRFTVFKQPHMPYTWGLLQSIPSLGSEHTGERLTPIKGLPPEPDPPAERLLVPSQMSVRLQPLPGRGARAAGLGPRRASVGMPSLARGQAADLADGGGTNPMSDPQPQPPPRRPPRWSGSGVSRSTSRSPRASSSSARSGGSTRSTASTWTSTRARRSAWSARPAAASRPWPA